MLATCKLAPPLAAGNTVVLKPFEFTFASSVTLARVFGEVGFPPGVRTVVTGFGVQVGVSLVAHRTVPSPRSPLIVVRDASPLPTLPRKMRLREPPGGLREVVSSCAFSH